MYRTRKRRSKCPPRDAWRIAKCCKARTDGSRQPNCLAGPEPAERSGREQRVDEAVERFEQDHFPRIAFPNAVGKRADSVSQKRSNADHPEDATIGRALCHCVNGEIRD